MRFLRDIINNNPLKYTPTILHAGDVKKRTKPLTEQGMGGGMGQPVATGPAIAGTNPSDPTTPAAPLLIAGKKRKQILKRTPPVGGGTTGINDLAERLSQETTDLILSSLRKHKNDPSFK